MSFLAATQVIVIEGADAFVRAHRDELGGCLETGFPGGHLVLCLKGKLDGRTKFAKAAAAAGWVIECEQPYDRPPPWEDRAPAWDSPLSHWLSRHAGTKELVLDPRTAFQLHGWAPISSSSMKSSRRSKPTWVNRATAGSMRT